MFVCLGWGGLVFGGVQVVFGGFGFRLAGVFSVIFSVSRRFVVG